MSDTAKSAVEELSESACWELLRSMPVGRLAVTIDGHPDIFPVNYVVDHGTVVFRTDDGSKLAGALAHNVAFETDGYDSETGEAWSVVVKGQAVGVQHLYAVLDTLMLPLFPWHEGRKPHFVRIEPTSVTGRRFTVSGGVRVTEPAGDPQ